MVTVTTVTFEDLVKMEPRLWELLRNARDYQPQLGRCHIVDWAKIYKPRLVKLVGWFARSEDPIIRSYAAYDIAYKKINEAMARCPRNCRGCS